jgi:hypothetical protein
MWANRQRRRIHYLLYHYRTIPLPPLFCQQSFHDARLIRHHAFVASRSFEAASHLNQLFLRPA